MHKHWRYLFPMVALACMGADLPVVTSEIVCRIPAERTRQFRLVTNQDMSKVAAIDQWGDEKKWYVALNSVVWEFYQNVDSASAQFSADGRHLSILAQHDGEWFLVTDDKDARPLGKGACRSLVLSPDGKHDACIQETEGGLCVLLDGKPLRLGAEVFTEISPLAFSAESQLYYTARDANRAYAVLDDKVVGELEADRMTAPVWQAKDQIAWAAVRTVGDSHQISHMRNSVEIAKYATPTASTSVAALTLSPSGQHVAWEEHGANGTLVRVGNDRQPALMASVSRIAISADHKHIAWLGRSVAAGRDVVVADGKTFTTLDSLDAARIEFDSEAKTLHVLTPTNRIDLIFAGEKWEYGPTLQTARGNLTVYAYPSFNPSTYVNNQKIEGAFLKAIKSSEDGAILLTESPTNFYVNDKPLTQVTRTVVKMPAK